MVLNKHPTRIQSVLIEQLLGCCFDIKNQMGAR